MQQQILGFLVSGTGGCPECESSGRVIPISAAQGQEMRQTGQVTELVICSCGCTYQCEVMPDGGVYMSVIERGKVVRRGKEYWNDYAN